jgi:hypothetical protein
MKRPNESAADETRDYARKAASLNDASRWRADPLSLHSRTDAAGTGPGADSTRHAGTCMKRKQAENQTRPAG